MRAAGAAATATAAGCTGGCVGGRCSGSSIDTTRYGAVVSLLQWPTVSKKAGAMENRQFLTVTSLDPIATAAALKAVKVLLPEAGALMELLVFFNR